VKRSTRIRLDELCAKSGCISYTVVRECGHPIVDFTHPAVAGPIRFITSATASDFRSSTNALAQLRRLIRQRREVEHARDGR
jgi:hypothetical protein